LAKDTRQVIWGEIRPLIFPKMKGGACVTIRAVDSTFFEVATQDQTALDKMMSSYKDVRHAERGRP
jgi:hypothetical protein